MAACYPSGSGVAEGTCRHVVNDRMKQTVAGAQAILNLRSIHLNGDWEAFVKHRIEAEQITAYGQRAA